MKKTAKKSTSLHHKKRHGHHQRRSKQFHHVYLPYLPLVVSIIISIVISGWRPAGNTLAYATNTSISGLLSSTNQQRSANGVGSLALNSQLNNAAQAKANDMVSRNYWSHNTPDGEEPWVFINNTGYKYLKAGENLAYGFPDSASTVNGWMNSPSHKANMLDGAFTEVGFGFANSPDFNDSGPETVVVAMYAKPQTLAATNAYPYPTPAAPAYATPATAPAATQPTMAPAPATPAETPQPASESPSPIDDKPVETPSFTTDTAGLEPVSVPVTRVAFIAGNKASFAVFGVGLMVGLAVTIMLMKHAIALRRLLRDSEQFVLHHPLFDSTVIGLLVIGVTLLQTAGFIR